jgi:hypothetical protein
MAQKPRTLHNLLAVKVHVDEDKNVQVPQNMVAVTPIENLFLDSNTKTLLVSRGG